MAAAGRLWFMFHATFCDERGAGSEGGVVEASSAGSFSPSVVLNSLLISDGGCLASKMADA